MTLTTADDTALKLHFDGLGRLWFLDGPKQAKELSRPIDEFLCEKTYQVSPVVRVLGTQANAALISRLHQEAKLGGPAVEVATPLVCATEAERNNPIMALEAMRRALLPASLGGWHILTDVEAISYELAVYAQQAGDAVLPLEALALFRRHPAYAALSFIRTVDEEAACRLVAEILDPRWFVDLRHPDRRAKLESYLGVCPHGISEAASPVPTVKGRRCRLVLRSWQWQELPAAYAFPLEPEALGTHPRDFLWRIWDQTGRGERGALRACQKLLQFVKAVWLDSLYLLKQQREPLFVPEHFFRTEECAAYQEHRKQLAGCSG